MRGCEDLRGSLPDVEICSPPQMLATSLPGLLILTECRASLLFGFGRSRARDNPPRGEACPRGEQISLAKLQCFGEIIKTPDTNSRFLLRKRYTGGRFRTPKSTTCIAFAKQKPSLGITVFDDFQKKHEFENIVFFDSVRKVHEFPGCAQRENT